MQQLTWMLALPCVVRVAVQLPLYLAGYVGGSTRPSALVAALGVSEDRAGLAAAGGRRWPRWPGCSARNRTPLVEPAPR